jgi:hypothetical protein
MEKKAKIEQVDVQKLSRILPHAERGNKNTFPFPFNFPKI